MSAESLPNPPFEIQANKSQVIFHTKKEPIQVDLNEKCELPEPVLELISHVLFQRARALSLLDAGQEIGKSEDLKADIELGDGASFILQLRYYFTIAEFRARFNELTKLVDDPVGILTEGLLKASLSYVYARKSEFKPYAMTCMRNAILDDARRVHYKYEVAIPERDQGDGAELEFGIGAAHSVEDTLLPQLQLEYIVKRIQNEDSPMPPLQRECLLAFIQYPHHSQAEIAQCLGVSESSFKSNLFRARQSLRQMLGADLVQDILS